MAGIASERRSQNHRSLPSQTLPWQAVIAIFLCVRLPICQGFKLDWCNNRGQNITIEHRPWPPLHILLFGLERASFATFPSGCRLPLADPLSSCVALLGQPILRVCCTPPVWNNLPLYQSRQVCRSSQRLPAHFPVLPAPCIARCRRARCSMRVCPCVKSIQYPRPYRVPPLLGRVLNGDKAECGRHEEFDHWR